MIPDGVRHELRLGGMPLGVLYIEPDVAATEALTPLVRGSSSSEEGGALVGLAGEVGAFRSLYESRTATRWAGEALEDLLGFARSKARKEIDPRIARAVASLSSFGLGPLRSMEALAAEVGLSKSRFQHLFTREVRVPFRRYRAWQRMRGAISEIVRGSSFGRAAHLAGFADQAHFGHDFRRTFGAAPSRSLTRLRKIHGNPCLPSEHENPCGDLLLDRKARRGTEQGISQQIGNLPRLPVSPDPQRRVAP